MNWRIVAGIELGIILVLLLNIFVFSSIQNSDYNNATELKWKFDKCKAGWQEALNGWQECLDEWDKCDWKCR